MNFFAEQKKARSKTKYLVGLFILALLGISFLLYLVVKVAIIYSLKQNLEQYTYSNWKLYFIILAITGLFICLTSLYKIILLSRGGGREVAFSLGGIPLGAEHTGLQYRQLYNIVEEMSIASGIAVPSIFILKQTSVNAFAAGNSTKDAVIGITQGALDLFSRDELQGVIAHEFSHIINGDMKINIRLSGIIFGLLAISICGKGIVEGTFWSSYSTRRSKDNGREVIMVLGLALWLIGYLGTLVGSIIKAMISREREYLADASAIQYTRNPIGIGGALKKIYYKQSSSCLKNHHEGEFYHMFFHVIYKPYALFHTHPPMEKRITRIEPSWKKDDKKEIFSKMKNKKKQVNEVKEKKDYSHKMLMASIGALGFCDLQLAQNKMAQLPKGLIDFVHQKEKAQLIAYTLLLCANNVDKNEQLKVLGGLITNVDDKVCINLVNELNERLYFVLLQISLPALKCLNNDEMKIFFENLESIINSDSVITIFEWLFDRYLRDNLIIALKYPKLSTFEAKEVILKTLKFYEDDNRKYEPLINIEKLNKAVNTYKRCQIELKEELVELMLKQVLVDEKINMIEYSLVRLFCITLDVPLPVDIENS